MVRNLVGSLCILLLWGGTTLVADPPSAPSTGRKTLGGTQYWTDELVCHGWRIQRNVRFGQRRLLSPEDRVLHSGTQDGCLQRFDELFRQADFPRIPATVLVTAHGLGRTRKSMSKLGAHVSKQGSFGWINFGYASTRRPILENAQALLGVLNSLAERRIQQGSDRTPLRVHFVGHSLGNILLRAVLYEQARGPSAWQAGRVVMLGPPNQGSALASLFKGNPLFRAVLGKSGSQLGAEWSELEKRLAVPRDFAVIAGGKQDGKGYNPLLAGDDDLVVRVEETQLAGARDSAIVPCIHTYLMNHKDVQEMTLRFLQEGRLEEVPARFLEQKSSVPAP